MKISLVFDTEMFGEIGVNIEEQLRLVYVWYTEDITWPREDTLRVLKYISRTRAATYVIRARPCNVVFSI